MLAPTATALPDYRHESGPPVVGMGYAFSVAPLFLLDLSYAPYALPAARRVWSERETVFSAWARANGVEVTELLQFARTLSEVALSMGEHGERFGRYGKDMLIGTLNEAWMKAHDRLLSEHCTQQQLRECLWQLEITLAAAEAADALTAPVEVRTLASTLQQPRAKG